MYCKKQQVPYGRAASAKTLTGISILAAVVVVLTVACNFIKFGPFSITLALAPIIIGSALYGKKAGGILGGVFGLVVLLTGLLGMDGGTVLYLCSQNAFATILICLVKGWAAGYLSGLVYEALWCKKRQNCRFDCRDCLPSGKYRAFHQRVCCSSSFRV